MLLVLFCLVYTAAASSLDPAHPTETLVLDTRVPIMAERKWAVVDQEELDRRNLEASDDTTSTAAAGTTVSLTVSAFASTTPLPSPLDGGLSSNFAKSSCRTFIYDFLANPTFKQCYPFSLLLEVSSSRPQKHADTRYLTKQP